MMHRCSPTSPVSSNQRGRATLPRRGLRFSLWPPDVNVHGLRRWRSGRPRLWYIVVVILMALSLSLSLSNLLYLDLVSTIEIIVYTILPHPSHRLASDSRPPFFILGRRHGGHDRLPLSGKAPVTIAPRWGWAPLARA